MDWEGIDWRENQKQSIDPPGVVVPMGAVGCNCRAFKCGSDFLLYPWAQLVAMACYKKTGVVVPMEKAQGVAVVLYVFSEVKVVPMGATYGRI